jgi:hypothetical protein
MDLLHARMRSLSIRFHALAPSRHSNVGTRAAPASATVKGLAAGA